MTSANSTITNSNNNLPGSGLIMPCQPGSARNLYVNNNPPSGPPSQSGTLTQSGSLTPGNE